MQLDVDVSTCQYHEPETELYLCDLNPNPRDHYLQDSMRPEMTFFSHRNLDLRPVTLILRVDIGIIHAHPLIKQDRRTNVLRYELWSSQFWFSDRLPGRQKVMHKLVYVDVS